MSFHEMSGVGPNPIWLFDASTGSETRQLPASYAVSRSIVARRSDQSGNTVTLTVASGQTLNGSLNGTVTIPAGGELRLVATESGQWLSLGGLSPAALAPSVRRLGAVNTAAFADRQSATAGPAAIPPVMASPPTVTSSGANGSGVTAITSAVNIPFVTSGVVTGPITISGPYTTTYQSQAGYVGPASLSGTGNETCPCWIEFDTDAATFDFYYLGSSSPTYRLFIDGEAVTATTQAANGSTGVFHVLRVANGSRKARHILLESNSMGVTSISIGPTDTMSPSAINRPRLAMITDSYGPNGDALMGLTATRMLGASPWIDGSGGTGYNNDQGGSGGKVVYALRIPAVLAAADPDALVFFGGINDSTTTLQADCLAAIRAARAIRPDLPIVVVGSENPAGAGGSGPAKAALLQAAAQAGGAAFVSMVTGHIYSSSGALLQRGTAWIAGSGNTGATTGTGNADLFISPDTVHPSTTAGVTNGYIYHGMRLGQALRVALRQAV
jgi:hypothetical protein